MDLAYFYDYCSLVLAVLSVELGHDYWPTPRRTECATLELEQIQNFTHVIGENFLEIRITRYLVLRY